MAILVAGTIFTPSSTTEAQGDGVAGTLVSRWVGGAPTMDGIADEAAWADAGELVIDVAGGSIPGDVTLRSVFTDTDIYIYAEWEDPTMSLTRGGGAWKYDPVPEDTMRATWTDGPPTVDGDPSDEVWDAAAPLTVAVRGGNNPTDIVLRALYNGTHIFVQKRWADPTFSIARGSSWFWDDIEQEWSHPTGQSEDRANIQWDIDAAGFEDQGCMVKCHVDAYSYLESPDDTTDLWHMKAARALPTVSSSQVGTPTVSGYEATSGEFHLAGYTDDQHVTYDEKQGAEADGGRHGDEGTSADSNNRNGTSATPKYIEVGPVDWMDAMTLRRSEIDAGETITADPADGAYNGTAVADAWARYDALGALVPERFLRGPSGSRGDIREAAIWKDGIWTVEMERLLETGHDDDVQFDDLDETYHFGVSVMDNGGGEDHDFHTGALHMEFAPDFAHLSGSEDRLTFLWEMGTITGFADQGCMVKCHPEFGGAGAFLDVDGEKGDLWHMKSARSLPTTSAGQAGTPVIDGDNQATSGTFSFKGFVDDTVLTYDGEPHEGDGGRHGDQGSPAYARNRNPAATAPLYLETAPGDYLDAMVLHRAEVDAGEVLVVADASREAVASAWAAYDALGAIVPENILAPPSGSRGDIAQAARWSGGTWSTEMSRKLTTGNDDDVQFDDAGAGYIFSISLMDDAGGDDHSTTGTDVYELVFFVPPTEYTITAGPVTDGKGNPVVGASVKVVSGNETLTGTTDAAGNASIVVPADWAGGNVSVTVSKKGYDDVSFDGAVSEDGRFSPAGGSYPALVKKETEESPGFGAIIAATTLLASALPWVRRRVHR